MTDPAKVEITFKGKKSVLTAEEAREIWEALSAIFGGADHYWRPEGKITTSGGGE